MMKTSKIGKSSAAAKVLNILFLTFMWILGITTVTFVLFLLFLILKDGLLKVDWGFLTNEPDQIEAGGGIGPILINSFYVLILSLIASVPISLGAGIYLAEYAPDNKLTSTIRVCVEGLSSVPSIVFGLIGFFLFVEYFAIGLTILGASLSLAMLNLPLLTRVAEEAIRAVPHSYREGSYALGATKLQTIFKVVLPSATRGLITGLSLVAGRAFGESAVIILAGGVTASGIYWNFDSFYGFFESFFRAEGGTLAVHLWYVQSEAIVPDAQEISQKSAAVLLFIVLAINLLFRVPIWFMERRMK
jgi:phosphate transport system permease protein